MNRCYMIFPVLWLVDESAGTACLEPTESNMPEKYIRINNAHKIVLVFIKQLVPLSFNSVVHD